MIMDRVKALYDRLESLHIKVKKFDHEPLFTCEQAQYAVEKLGIPGAQCKNLFLKDSKKKLWLIVALADTKIELKKIGKMFDAKELRFADALLLMENLGVEPGSVTPFALINDMDHKISVILDSALFSQHELGFHPLKNDATLIITPADLKKFIESCGNQSTIFDFTAI